MKKVNRMSLGDLATIMEQAPEEIKSELKPSFRKKFFASKDLDSEERSRYVTILKSLRSY
jgi:hypothetical protein